MAGLDPSVTLPKESEIFTGSAHDLHFTLILFIASPEKLNEHIAQLKSNEVSGPSLLELAIGFLDLVSCYCGILL